MLKVTDLKKHYHLKRFLGPEQTVKALDGVSFNVGEQKTLAVVGESGCGKSTLAKLLIQIEEPTAGDIQIQSQSILNLPRRDSVSKIQMIFQDPYSSINPRKKAWQIISEPLSIQDASLSKTELRSRAQNLMKQVGLRPEFADRYPHMFSGGQRQRIGIARALLLQPKMIVCDEPVSALDVSIQAQVLNLLMDLQDEFKLSYLFISHDLSVVRHISDEIIVMYLGRVVEQGTRTQIFETPQHPYTRALLSSAPHLKMDAKNAVTLEGELPSPLNPPQGCALNGRCPYAQSRCKIETPRLEIKNGRLVSCFEVK